MGYIEGESLNGIPCRVYATAGKEEQGAFALDCCEKVLAYFSKYFGKATLAGLRLCLFSEHKLTACSNEVVKYWS